MELTLWGAFLMGLFMGLGPCLATCAPFLLSYVAGTATDRMSGLFLAVFFGFGRVIALLSIGVALAVLGSAFQSAFRGASEVAIVSAGILNIFLGINMTGYLNPINMFTRRAWTILRVTEPRYVNAAGSLVLGLLMGYSPCAPLLVLSGTVSAMVNRVMGVLIMTAFAMGTLVPAIPLGWVTGGAVELLKRTQLIRRLSGVALIALGLLLVVGLYI